MSDIPLLSSSKLLQHFLTNNPEKIVQTERRNKSYDLISFGGGSCPKVIGPYAKQFGWDEICFITNGSDNGGSTQKIVESLKPKYGATLPVGDITSGLIALLPEIHYELLNLRKWNLDPIRFSQTEIDSFRKTINPIKTFHGRLSITIDCYRNNLCQSKSPVPDSFDKFCKELLFLATLVDDHNLIIETLPGLEIDSASVRHQIFNAIMIHVGAYDSETKKADREKFMVGLRLLECALGLNHIIFPASIDEQVLFAEWADEIGNPITNTNARDVNRPEIKINGQAALSNITDKAKRLKNNKLAKIGKFGFISELPTPGAYPEALNAIQQLKPGCPIIFGPSSYVASTSPCLAIHEISIEVSKRIDCPKLLILNLTRNNETVGWSVSDYLDFWELNTKMEIRNTVDYVIVNNDITSTREIVEALSDKGDSLNTFKFRGPVAVESSERDKIIQRGINLAEAPLATVKRQLMRLSSDGDRQFTYTPAHHNERLMSLCYCLTNEFNQNKESEKLTLCDGSIANVFKSLLY